MTFDSQEVQTKINEVENKISLYNGKLSELRQLQNKLTFIVDKNDFERNDDGSIKFDQNGQQIRKMIPPVDEFTGEVLSDERRTQIKNVLFAKFDELNQSS